VNTAILVAGEASPDHRKEQRASLPSPMYQCQLHSQRHRSLSDALFASSMEFETPTRTDTTPALDFCGLYTIRCGKNKLCQAETKGAFDCTYPYLGEASVGY
ncbi:unnamed protein product, partial [Musa acuminata subsp. burmannicoides]